MKAKGGGRPILLAAILLCALGGWPAAISAQALLGGESVEDLRTGRFYHGGTRVRIPLLGASFTVPRQWRARLPAGSQVVHLDSPRQPGLGIVLLLADVTSEDVEGRLSEPLAFEEAYVLDPIAAVEREGSRLSASYLHGDQVGRAVALLGPDRQAMVYVMAGPEKDAALYERVLAGLADSTEFVDRETAARLTTWYNRLSGSSLTHAVGATAKKWHFCSDGRFLYRFRRLPDGEKETGGFEESGRWRIEIQGGQPTLIVQARHALPRSHRLRSEGDALFMDGDRFERRASNQCF